MRAEIKSHRRAVVVVFALAISISYLHPSFADTIILSDGSEFKGVIIENLKERITLKVKNGVKTFNKEDIQSIREEKIPVDLTLTKDGVEDEWGSSVPPRAFNVNLALEIAANLGPESKNGYYKSYLSMAEEYEERAKSKSIPELRQAGLMTALIYYRIASNSPEEKIRKPSQSGAERCYTQLFNPRKEEIAIPFGSSMNEHINLFMGKLNGEKEKEKYANIYLKLGQDYEAKLSVKGLSSEERFRNIQIAANCYYIARDYSSAEKTKLVADKALSELQSKQRP